MSEKNYESGYCSFCFKYTKHHLMEQNYLRRNKYYCSNCKKITVMCRVSSCNNFTKSSTTWDNELCAEHNGEIANFKMLEYKLEHLEDYKKIFQRESLNVGKISTITAVTLGTMAVVMPLTLAAAPAIGSAIIGSGMGVSGVVAIDTGLAAIGIGALGTGGTAILGATGAALGATIGGVVSNSYFGEIDGFGIKKVKEGKGSIVIFIDGFLSQKDDNTDEWEQSLKKIYPDNPWYYLTWESKRLYDIGSLLVGQGTHRVIKHVINKAIKEGTKTLNPISRVLSAVGLANNPWSVALVKAGQTGILLADIIARTDKKYILCGHSLGARVIYYALESLSTKDQKFISSVHLLGGAVGSDKKDWEKAKSSVSDKIINYRSDNDYVLATMYKAGTFFSSNPIGRNDIEVEGILNVDTTSIVSGHLKYKENFSLFAKLR